jgi:hypothetical protein
MSIEQTPKARAYNQYENSWLNEFGFSDFVFGDYFLSTLD